MCVRSLHRMKCYISVNNVITLLIIHRQFCKNLPSSATNLGVYGELGRRPLCIRRKLQMIKYWEKLANLSIHSPLLYNCLEIQEQKSLKWAVHIRGIIKQCGLSYLWERTRALDSIPLAEVKQILSDQYLQEWSSNLHGTSDKI